MKIIYANNSNLEWWVNQANLEVGLTNDIDSEYNIALWETQDFSESQELELENLVSKCNLVCVFLPEFISDHWCAKFDRPNVVFFIAGKLNYTLRYARVFFHYYFFWSTTDFYHTHSEFLNQLVISHNKPKKFDILLGRKKKHRTMIFDQIDHEQNVVTYFDQVYDEDLRSKSTQSFLWPEEILAKPNKEICWTGDEVIVNDTIVSLSQLVPINVYNSTYYSLIAETQCENSFSFFTEKIIKPLMAQRLFIVSSGQFYLKNLKKLGFKTFDNVIDESYDNEPDMAVRTKMIVDQVNLLSKLDPTQVYMKIKDRVDYNKELILGTKWLDLMVYDLKNVLLAAIE